MKKTGLLFLSILITLTMFGCNRRNDSSLTMETLRIGFAPTLEPENLNEAASPIGELVKETLNEEGYNIENVEITIASSNDALVQGLEEGIIDVAFMPSSTYAQAESKNLRPILVGLVDRQELQLDGIEDIYTDKLPECEYEEYQKYKRSMIYVNVLNETGASIYQQALEGTLTYDKLFVLNWAVGNPNNEASYIYPSAWLKQKFNSTKALSNIKNVVGYQSDYDNFSALLRQEVDVTVGPADLRELSTSYNAFRILYPDLVQQEQSIYDVIKVIGVTAPIMNPVLVSSSNEIMTNELIEKVQKAFENVLASEQAQNCLNILGVKGFASCQDNDFDLTREVYK